MGSRFFRQSAVILAIGLLGQAAHSAPAVYQWTGASGNWSIGSNWLGGVAPPIGGDPTGLLILGDAQNLSSSDNNLGGAFTVNQINFNNNAGQLATLRNMTGSSLRLDGANAAININGQGRYALTDQTSTNTGTVLAGNVAINLISEGSLSITSQLTGSGGLTISGAQGFYGNSQIQIGSGGTVSNTFSGGVTLNSGHLVLNGAGSVNAPSAPLGTGTLTVNGGTISSASAQSRIGNSVILNSDLQFGFGTQTFNGAISAASDAVGITNLSGSMFINNTVNIRGVTQIGVANSTYLSNAGVATVTLAGNGTGGATTGTLLNTSAIRLVDGGSLIIDNSGTSNANLANRVNDAAAISMGTVNALVMESATTVSLTGTGTVSIASGALVSSGGGGNIINNNLDFGSTEAFITNTGNLAVTGNLTGNMGLTKAGSHPLVLSGDNSGLTGQLTLLGNGNATVGPRIDIMSANSLPGTGTIVIKGADTTGAPGIGIAGPVTVSRDIRVDAGLVGLTTLNSSSVATFSGNISGIGSVAINTSNSLGLVVLSGQNSYTGVTRVGAGTVQIGSDANLGNGGQLILSTSSETQGIQITNNWTTSRQVNVITLSGIQTGAFNATLNGELFGTGGLSKFGSGALVLNGGGNYSGKLTVYEGSLIVNSNLPTANVTVSGGVLGGTGAVGDVIVSGVLAPGSFAGAQGHLGMDSLALTGGSAIAFDLGTGGDSLGVTGALSRTGASANLFTFLFTSLDGLQAGQSYDLIDFGSTTLSAADFAFQSNNSSLAGSFSIVGNSLMFNVTAVPEPTPGALMLAGLAALGWLAKRRKG